MGLGGGKKPWKYEEIDVGEKERREDVRDMKVEKLLRCLRRVLREEKMIRWKDGNFGARQRERENEGTCFMKEFESSVGR